MEEKYSDEEKKDIEKILYDLNNLQIRASILASKNLKDKDLDQVEIDFETDEFMSPAEQVDEISNEFSTITEKLSTKLKNKSVEKTLNKIKQCNVYNQEMVSYYLEQLIKDMKGVSEKTKSIINVEGLQNQLKQEQEKHENVKKSNLKVVANNSETKSNKVEESANEENNKTVGKI